MPIYEYEHEVDDAGCPRFEAVESMSAPPLAACPRCGKPVHRILSAFGVKSSGKDGVLSRSNLEANGFTQYKRKGDGYYEKTAGVGPQAIASED